MLFKKYLSSPFFYIFLLIVGYFSFTKLADGDFGFHLMQGKYFFENHWQLPTKEVFSYSIVGQTNIILSWLFDVWVYFVYAKLGLFGLSLWKSVAFVLLGILFIFRLENLAQARKFILNQWVVYGAAFLFLAAVFPWANIERPHAVGYLCFSLFLLLISLFLEGSKWWHWTGFIILQLFWANTHTSFFVSIIISFILLIGLLIEKSAVSKRAFFLLIILVIVSVINPYGLGIFNNFFKASPSVVYEFVTELRATVWRDFISLSGLFWILSLLPLIKFWKNRNFKMLLLFAAFAFLGLRSFRFSFDYVVLTAPFCVIEVLAILRLGGQADRQASPLRSPAPALGRSPRARQGWRACLPARQGWAGAKDLPACIAVVAAALICGLVFVVTAREKEHGFGFTINDPVWSAEFILKNKIQGKMFNSFNLGSYLIWHLYPQYQVFIDTRAQNYIQGGDDSLLRNYYKVISRDPLETWQKLDEKYNFNFAVVEWPYIRDNKAYNSTDKVFTSDKWALVFMDPKSLVYLRRDEINKELIEKYEYKYIQPQNFDSQYLKNYLLNPSDWEGASKEFQRAINEGPPNYRVHFLYAAFLSYNPASSQAEIVDQLKKTIELNPKFEPAKKILKQLKDKKII